MWVVSEHSRTLAWVGVRTPLRLHCADGAAQPPLRTGEDQATLATADVHGHPRQHTTQVDALAQQGAVHAAVQLVAGCRLGVVGPGHETLLDLHLSTDEHMRLQYLPTLVTSVAVRPPPVDVVADHEVRTVLLVVVRAGGLPDGQRLRLVQPLVLGQGHYLSSGAVSGEKGWSSREGLPCDNTRELVV